MSDLLGGLFSAGGVGMSAYNQQQAYNGLQSALKTIGPTSLNGYTLGGPGGMSSGYNPNGSGNISLGSLNPAFGNLSGAAGAGSGLYDPSMLSNLTGNANGTLGQSTNALNSAYGNYNAGMGAANTQLGSLDQTYGQVYNGTLGNLQAMQQPGVQQQAFGLQNSLFGKGTLDSTGATSGAISAANFGSQVNSMNAQDSLTAQQQALAAQTAGANNYATLSNSANGILSNAFNNFGNTNQLISGLNTAQLNNSLQAVQGAGSLNSLGLNNYNAALQTGSAQSTARNQSLFPYASVATSLAGTQNGSNILGGALSSAGNSLSGTGAGSGLSGLLSSLLSKGASTGAKSLFNNLLNGSGSGNSIASQYASGLQGYDSSLLSGASNQVGSDIASGTGSWAGSAGYAPDLSNLGDMSSVNFGDALSTDAGSFSSAGGGAAADAGGLGFSSAAAASPALETVGTGAIDAAADAGASAVIPGLDAGAGAAGAEGGATAASGAGASSAGFGAAAGGAAALGLALAPALIGMSTPAVQLTGKYWGGVTNSLQSAIDSGDRGQIAAQVNGLLAQPQNQIPANIQKLVYSTGFVPKTGWGQGPIGTLTGKGGSTGTRQASRS